VILKFRDIPHLRLPGPGRLVRPEQAAEFGCKLCLPLETLFTGCTAKSHRERSLSSELFNPLTDRQSSREFFGLNSPNEKTARGNHPEVFKELAASCSD
jgi:hypothetical protein